MKNKEYLKRCGVKKLLKLNIKSREELMTAKRQLAKKYGVGIIKNSDILQVLNAGAIPSTLAGRHELPLQKILRKRAVRTLSGVAPVAVLVKPFPCPGKCAYCPTEKGVPQSYLSNEPAVMRAIRCGYEPCKQVQLRLRALEANGHKPMKIELIVIGGTWSVLPQDYKYWYIWQCFKAANNYQKLKNPKSEIRNPKQIQNSKFKIQELKNYLKKEQKRNEKAKYKIIGLTLETRPDYINERELIEMRELGCTRVELGVQAVDNKILAKNLRGHGIKEIAEATRMLKDFGFKATYHIMPGLPGSTPAKDLKMFKMLFGDEKFRPDQLKFYPTIVTRGSLLYKWWKVGRYKPYSKKALENLIIKCKKVVPEYVRIVRLIRDIPAESIIAGNTITNLRQVLAQRGVKCRCIRCRECRDKKLEVRSKKLEIIKYKASKGDEYFLQYTDKDGKIFYGFCRLRLKDTRCLLKTPGVFPALDGAALIRELHVYGELVPIPSAGSGQVALASLARKKKVQHEGLGKKLMKKAEKIARAHGYKKIAIIAGVGAREYYRKLGYRQKNTYMLKDI